MPMPEADQLRTIYPWYEHPDATDLTVGFLVAAGASLANIAVLVTHDDNKQQVIYAAQTKETLAQAKASFLDELYDSINNKHSIYHLGALAAAGRPPVTDGNAINEYADQGFNQAYVTYRHDPDVKGIIASINEHQTTVRSNILIHDSTAHAQNQVQAATAAADVANNRFPAQKDKLKIGGMFTGAILLGLGAYLASRKIRNELYIKKHGKEIADTFDGYLKYHTHEDS